MVLVGGGVEGEQCKTRADNEAERQGWGMLDVLVHIICHISDIMYVICHIPYIVYI